jgi:hypothetical protein
MRRTRWMTLLPVAVLSVACGRNSSPAADDALKNDLALASQMSPANAQISPTEAGYAPQQLRASATPAAVRRAPAATVRRAPARRSSGSSSSGGYYPAPAPAPAPIVKHTGRDAAIGAAAGAVIGAVSARDKVKGGLIGAAAGGIIGAVVGNNVDIGRRPF